MVWRSNIKVLVGANGCSPLLKAFPLLISMLLHMVILSVFAVVNHEKERVFTVELIAQDLECSTRPKSKNISTGMEKISNKKVSLSRTDLKRKSEPLKERVETTHIDTHKAEVLTMADNMSPAKSADIASVNPPFPHLEKGGEGRFSDKSGHGFKEKGSNSGNDIVEGEFASINGPSFLKTIKPEYPRLARRLGKEGKVVLRLFIDEHGRLVSVEIFEKAGHGFDEAAIDAVKASTFKPAKLNGHPVACKALLPIRFRLE